MIPLSPWERFIDCFNRFLCQVFGHKYYYDPKLDGDYCPRCKDWIIKDDDSDYSYDEEVNDG